MKKIITLIVAYLCLSVSHAQAQNAPTSQQVTLHVATAGTLPDMIDPSRRPYITNLKLTGELNGDDLLMIREMAGADGYGNPTQGALEHLDLSEAEIVNGGETYYIDVDSAFFFLTGTITINTYYTNKHIYDDGSRRYEDSNTGFDCLLAACHKLKSVKLPPRHTWGSVFNNCTGLTSVDIPEGVMDLSRTFWGCTSLTSINIPEGVMDLSRTFWGCTSLTSINIPEGVTNLSSTFYGCTSLTSVNIPEGVTNLSSTFYGCTSLTSVNIPESVTNLSRTFWGCTSLTSIDIPESATNLSGTFSGCTSLTSIDIPESVTNLSGTYSGCTSLTSVNIPEGVTNLYNTFDGCTSLTSVNISGDQPLALDESYNNLDKTFEDCPNLRAIRFFSPTPLILSSYPELNGQVTIYIPKGSYMSYWVTGWGNYNLMEFDAVGIDTPMRTNKAGVRSITLLKGSCSRARSLELNIVRKADGTTKKVFIQRP